MPRYVLISYSDRNYSEAQQLLTATAKQIGKLDEVYAFGPKDIDASFYQHHHAIFRYARGGGYWLWKPYFIRRVLRLLSAGDILFYTDASAVFLKPATSLLSTFANHESPIMAFGPMEIAEKHCTKRDCLIALDCDTPDYTETGQFDGSHSIWKPLPASFVFLDQWLGYASDPHLITDTPSRAPNYAGFIAHRHDQSLFSLLYKKHGYTPFRNIRLQINDRTVPVVCGPYGHVLLVTGKRNVLPYKKIIGRMAQFLKRLPIPYTFLRMVFRFLDNHLRAPITRLFEKPHAND